MEETGTKITVSSINEINSFNVERIITISGDIDNISKAEAEVSAKLRAAYENDIQNVTVRCKLRCKKGFHARLHCHSNSS